MITDPTPSELAVSPAATTLALVSVDGGVLGLDIDASTTTGEITRTIEGASQLTLTVHDPTWAILNSRLLETDTSGRFLRPIELQVGPLWFRLVKVSPSDETLTLTFEDREVSLLRDQTTALQRDRRHSTMAEFADALIRGTKDDRGRLRSWIPELHEQQRLAGASTTDQAAKDARRESGLPKGMTIRQWDGSSFKLGDGKRANAELVLATALSLTAPDRAVLALLEACIVESALDNLTYGDGTSVGILQATDAHFGGSTSTKGGRRDIAKVTKYFLQTGFTGKGGAIALAKAHPDWTTGQIAQTVQGSGYGSRYQEVESSAKELLEAYGGGGGSPDGTKDASAKKPYCYKVTGNYWNTLTNYAEAVNWRCFVSNGVVYFVSDERLFLSRARTTISRSDVDDLTFDLDLRKETVEVTFTCRADFWAAPPGSVVLLQDAGPASGRYLVKSTDRGLVDPTTTITLTKPMLKKAEEADDGSDDGSAKKSTGPTADGGFDSGTHLAAMYAEMVKIDKRKYAYKYGGGHGAGFNGGPYDCSGAVSAVLHAGGLLSAPMSTSGLIGWGQSGRGTYLTVWVKEIANQPQVSHTFITLVLKDSGDTVYFEAGGNDSSHTGFHTARSHDGFQPRTWPGL
jgi:hypothetical protein